MNGDVNVLQLGAVNGTSSTLDSLSTLINNENTLPSIGIDVDEDIEIISPNNADDCHPGGTGTIISIPRDIRAEPGFLARFSNRLNELLSQEGLQFCELESIAEDLIKCIKSELNFKSSSSDGAALPYKLIDPDDSTEIQNLYPKNRKKAFCLILKE